MARVDLIVQGTRVDQTVQGTRVDQTVQGTRVDQTVQVARVDQTVQRTMAVQPPWSYQGPYYGVMGWNRQQLKNRNDVKSLSSRDVNRLWLGRRDVNFKCVHRPHTPYGCGHNG